MSSEANRIHLSRNSCGYFPGAGMTPPLRGIRPSTKAGSVHSATHDTLARAPPVFS